MRRLCIDFAPSACNAQTPPSECRRNSPGFWAWRRYVLYRPGRERGCDTGIYHYNTRRHVRPMQTTWLWNRNFITRLFHWYLRNLPTYINVSNLDSRQDWLFLPRDAAMLARSWESLCPSVCPSVRRTRAWQNQTMHFGYLDTTRKDNYSSFLTPTMVRGRCL